MLPGKLPLKQLQVIWHSMINSIIHQRWSGKCYCLLPKYLYLTCTWLKKYLMYLMSSKYSEYLNFYLYLQIWKSTCTWLKYFKKYLTPTLLIINMHVFMNWMPDCNINRVFVRIFCPICGWCRRPRGTGSTCVRTVYDQLYIGFRSDFNRREISSVYLWCWWQRTKIERQNSMRNLWIKAWNNLNNEISKAVQLTLYSHVFCHYWWNISR